MAKKNIFKAKVDIKNRRAEHDFYVMDRYVAGMVLTGTEIKSIRAGKAWLADSFCFVLDGEMWAKNIYIAPYEQGSYNNHSLRRDRKLLLNKREIQHLHEDTKSPGFSIVPLRLFIDEKGLAKLEIGLCRGKKAYDKRAVLKEKEDRREMERVTKKFRV